LQKLDHDVWGLKWGSRANAAQGSLAPRTRERRVGGEMVGKANVVAAQMDQEAFFIAVWTTAADSLTGSGWKKESPLENDRGSWGEPREYSKRAPSCPRKFLGNVRCLLRALGRSVARGRGLN